MVVCFFVMAGLVPAIHDFVFKEDVDARHKACARAARKRADPCAGHDRVCGS